MQKDTTFLANNSQHSQMIHVNVASVSPPCCILLSVRNVWNLLSQTSPNISFVSWSSKRSATILGPFAQLFQHCWSHALALHIVSKVIGHTLPTMHCRSQHCLELLNIFADHCQHGRSNSQHTLPPPVGRRVSSSPFPVFKMVMIITTYHTVFSNLKICRPDPGCSNVG